MARSSPLDVAGQAIQLGILGGVGYVAYQAALNGSLGAEAQEAAIKLYRVLHGGQEPPADFWESIWDKIVPGGG